MRLAMTVSLPLRPASVTRARDVLNTLLSLTDVTDECRADLAILITEGSANAVMHAPDGTIDITITIDDHACLVEVGNRGTNPDGATIAAELPDPLTVHGRGRRCCLAPLRFGYSPPAGPA